MQNEPIFSNNPNQKTAIFSNAESAPAEKNAKGFRTPKNTPSPKHIGIGIAAAVLVAAVGIFLLIPKDTPVRANEFNENASSSRQVEGKNLYAELVDFEILDEAISPEVAEELEKKASLFFTYTYPKIATLTVKKTETVETKSPEETSEEENPITTKTFKYHLTADNGKKFIIEVVSTSNLSSVGLSILDDHEKELYSYESGTIDVNPYYSDSEILLDALITLLPYSSETETGEQFDVTFEGDSENRLTISAKNESDVLSAEACESAKEKAVEWAKTLTLNYYGDITADNFVCE